MAYTSIDDPSVYFQTALHTGNAGTQSIVNDGNSDLQPDWVWIKGRTTNSHHAIFDAVRGVTKRISASENNAETTETAGLTSFNTDGWSTGSWSGSNANTKNYVSWQWKVGGAGSENTTGDLTVTALSVNQTAGISIGKITDGFTSTGSNSETIGHGLGYVPKMIMIKNTEATSNWEMYHVGIGNTKKVKLNSADAAADSTLFNNTTPTSSVWSVRGGDFATGEDIVFYALADVQGYQKIGSYLGNGNADGPFVYTGFKPAFVMAKRAIGGNGSWWMRDRKIAPFNLASQVLVANSDGVETNGVGTMDILSNGFKLKDTTDATNNSSGTYIYWAIAENPFVTSTGVPACAR